MDVNPLHHGATDSPYGVDATRRTDPDGQRRGQDGSASGEAAAAGPVASQPDAPAERPPDVPAEDLLLAHDPVFDALIDADGHREATLEHPSANRRAAAYRDASKTG